MSTSVSERNFLERLTDLIPGIEGYRAREHRRETDRRLREFLAGRLEEARDSLNPVRARFKGERGLELLTEVGRLDRTLQKCVAALRFANQGYGGLFDLVKIAEPELARLYAFDEELLDEVRGLSERVGVACAAGPDESALAELVARAERLDRAIERRHEILHAPIES